MNSHLQFKILLLFLLNLTLTYSFAQTTYTVTSTSKDGPGSINEAITLANSNPGTDSIKFTSGLQINASHSYYTGGVNGNYMISITESVIIDGNGGALNGYQKWVSANGDINPLGQCPGSIPSTIILRQMPNFMQVGVFGEDNSGISVTIKNLTIKEFNSIAEVRQGTSLIVDNLKAENIWASYRCDERGLFEVLNDATLSIKNSEFKNSVNWGDDGVVPSIGGISAGNLTIENCLFYNNNNGSQFMVDWNGAGNSEVNIVNSRFLGSGGIHILGSVSETNIVNTSMVNNNTGTPEAGDRIVNNASGPMNITASSIKWNSNECNALCPISSQILIESQNGVINFSESAIGFNFPETTGTLLATLGGSGSFTADANTWIEPTSNQDAAALQTITSQPNLITSTPGFVTEVATQVAYNDAELVKPDVTGVLIDVINSDLINPIDGNLITTDVLGNDRFDPNGFRDIGALQLGLAPTLTITATSDQAIDISWQEPLHHDGDPILRYEYQYVEVGGGFPTVVDAGLSLSVNITGLKNGAEYQISVRAVYNESSLEVNGPFSNLVTATPYSALGVPNLTATAGDGEVALSWDIPDLGGRTFEFYDIIWKIDGETDNIDLIAVNDMDQTDTVVTGLTNGTTYEFAIFVRASGESSNIGYATETPSGPTSIANVNGNNLAVTVYPNPATQNVTIKAQKDVLTVKILTTDGIVMSEVNDSDTIDITSLSDGIYILHIITEENEYFERIVKK